MTRAPRVEDLLRDRAMAAAMVHGPAQGLKLLEALDERLPGHYRLDAVRAHMFEIASDVEAAVKHYRAAASRTTSLPEQHYLTTVTHPFHPLLGRRLPVLFAAQTRRGLLFVCEVDGVRRVTLRQEWTDRVPSP